MYLVIFWITFILFVSSFEELNQQYFFFFSGIMLCLTYLYNKFLPSKVSLRNALVLFNISGLILWYVGFVYNDFLSINPISYETFMGYFFIYTYLVLYFYLEHPKSHLI